MQLNEQQEIAANHDRGPCLVVSVPGSGKTRLLVERTARLVEKSVDPAHIICVTFTNKSADEMKERIAKRLNVKKLQMFAGTFHVLCARILRKFGHLIGYTTKYTIIDSDDQKDLVQQIGRQLGITVDRPTISKICKAVNDYRETLCSHEDMERALFDNEGHIRVADEYLDRLKRSNAVDFSGLLSETLTLLRLQPQVRESIQQQFEYLMCDECQDTNLIQFELLNTFCAKHNNIMLVGDISQSIYRFRGARYQNVKDFLAKHEDCRIVEMSKNYRSTPEIIKVADTLIRKNVSHMAEKFETDNPSGENVRCLRFDHQIAEADWVSGHVSDLINKGYRPGDIAILYRINAMSEPVERALMNRRIAYEVVGGRSFYDRKEVKDCMAMLRFACNPKDGIAFHRTAIAASCGLGDVTIGKIELLAMEKDTDILTATKSFGEQSNHSNIKAGCLALVKHFEFDKVLGPAECLNTLVNRFKYGEHLEKNYPEDFADRYANVRQLIDSAADFAESNDNSVEKYLQMVSLATSSDKKADKDRVSLMSCHGCKGLEFPVVFVVGVEQGIMPHGLAIEEDPIEGLEEERRILYVAMTRAEKLLYTSHCRSRRVFGREGVIAHKPARPSQFLFESGLLQQKEMRV